MNAEWAAERVAESPLFRTPFDPTAEQWERESHYAPFVAWELWMSYRMDKERDDAFEAWENMNVFARLAFFSAMMDALEFAAKNKP